MYANNTWLDCITQNDKLCANGMYVHSRMNTASTFGSHRMDGRDTIASLMNLHTYSSSELCYQMKVLS